MSSTIGREDESIFAIDFHPSAKYPVVTDDPFDILMADLDQAARSAFPQVLSVESSGGIADPCGVGEKVFVEVIRGDLQRPTGAADA